MRPASVIEAVDERDGGAVQLALADERDLDVLRHEDPGLEAGRRRVRGHGVGGVAGGRHREDRRAEIPRARDRGGQPARLERVRRVERLVLHEQARNAEIGAEPCRMDQGGPAFAEREGRFAVRQRHQLAIPPHVRLARRERVPAPGAGGVEIVAHQQGSAADAEVVFDLGIVARRPAGDGALEVGEVGHVSSSASFQLPVPKTGKLKLDELVAGSWLASRFTCSADPRPSSSAGRR